MQQIQLNQFFVLVLQLSQSCLCGQKLSSFHKKAYSRSGPYMGNISPQKSGTTSHLISKKNFGKLNKNFAGYFCKTFCFRCDVEPVPDNPQHEQYVASLVNSLIQEIENKAATVFTDAEFFLTKMKLAEAAKMFRQRYRLVLNKHLCAKHFEIHVQCDMLSKFNSVMDFVAVTFYKIEFVLTKFC